MWQKVLQAFKLKELWKPRMLAEQLTNLSRERSKGENLKKHLPVLQEHGKNCCLFYVGEGPKSTVSQRLVNRPLILQNTEIEL